MTKPQTYNNMTGGLFDGKPLEYVGPERGKKTDTFFELCMHQGYAEGGPARKMLADKLREQVGRQFTDSKLAEQIDFAIHYASLSLEKAKKNRDERCGTARGQKIVYEAALRKVSDSCVERLS